MCFLTPLFTAHWNVNILMTYCRVSRCHVNMKTNKTRFFRLMLLSHFGKFVRLFLCRYYMAFYAIWTAAWAMFHLQNGVIPIIFWDIKHIMKTQAKVCNFWLWKFATREQSTKKWSGNTVVVFNMLKIDDGMNELVNKFPRQKVLFWTFQTIFLM